MEKHLKELTRDKYNKKFLFRMLKYYDNKIMMNKLNNWIQDKKKIRLFGLGVKVISENKMSDNEEISHMCTPCPICGKVNEFDYFRSSSFIPGIEIYMYTCKDSSHILRLTDKEVDKYDQVGCGAKYKIKINKNKELIKPNLQLSKREMLVLTNSTLNKSIDEIERAQEKQRKYWTKRYAELGIKK